MSTISVSRAGVARSFVACLVVPSLCAAASEGSADATLDAVAVNGTRQPYRTLVVTGAMKTDTPVRDLAQSVRVCSPAVRLSREGALLFLFHVTLTSTFVE